MKKRAAIGARTIGAIVLISLFLVLFFYAFFGEESPLDKLKSAVFSFGNRSPIKVSIGQEPIDIEIPPAPKAKAVFEELDSVFKKWSKSPANDCLIYLKNSVNDFEKDHYFLFEKTNDNKMLISLWFKGDEVKGLTKREILHSEDPPKLSLCILSNFAIYKPLDFYLDYWRGHIAKYPSLNDPNFIPDHYYQSFVLEYDKNEKLKLDQYSFYNNYGANLLYKTPYGFICFIPTSNTGHWLLGGGCQVYDNVLDYRCIDEFKHLVPSCEFRETHMP